MTSTVIIVGLIAAGVHFFRRYWFKRELPQAHSMVFDGELHQVGATTIAIKRPESAAAKTLVCIPGFLEDVRYFLSLYEGRGYELILINNANYHSPFVQEGINTLAWQRNPHAAGSIEHDAFLVGHAIKHFATTDDIVLHGHSRGAAVVMDAGRQFPDLMKDETRRIAALLEAPVVPQGTPAGGKPGPLVAALTLYLLPVFLGLSRNITAARLEKFPMMRPTNELKTNLCRTLFCNTKSYATCVDNVRNITEWQQKQRHDLYENYREITLLVGERDDVLSNETMLASATAGAERNPQVRIIQTTDTNHFISLEKPEAIYEALGEAGSRRGRT